MKYKKYPIIIDPEFRSLIPPLSADEQAQLTKNIWQHGLLDQIVVWATSDGFVIIDGHHRYEILKKLATEPDSEFFEEELDKHEGEINGATLYLRHYNRSFDESRFRAEYFQSREAVKLWILEHQVGRRNLTKQQRIDMVAKIVLLRQEQSAAISKANLKKGDAAPDVTETVPSGKRTVAAAAEEFDVPREPLQAAVNKAKGKSAILPRIRKSPPETDSISSTPSPDATPTKSRTTELREWFQQQYPYFEIRQSEIDRRMQAAGKSRHRTDRYDLLLANLTRGEIRAIGELLSQGLDTKSEAA
jgi:hypothetical protein